jgi:hypothetical protein
VEDFYEHVNDPSGSIKFRNLLSTKVSAYLQILLYHAANMMLHMNQTVIFVVGNSSMALVYSSPYLLASSLKPCNKILMTLYMKGK